MRRKPLALLAPALLAFLGACSDERLARLEECGGQSDNHPLCIVYALTGAEWAITGAFALGLAGLIAGLIGSSKKREDGKDDDDATPGPEVPD